MGETNLLFSLYMSNIPPKSNLACSSNATSYDWMPGPMLILVCQLIHRNAWML